MEKQGLQLAYILVLVFFDFQSVVTFCVFGVFSGDLGF